MARRKKIGKSYSGNSIFSARIICGECGCFYGPRYWDNKSNRRQIVWRCSKKYGKDGGCGSPIIPENELEAKFVDAINEIIDERETVLERCRSLYESFKDTTSIDDEISDQIRECEITAKLSQELVEENAGTEMNQDVFRQKYGYYEDRYDEAVSRIGQLKALRVERLQKAELISGFMFEVHEQERLIEEFSEKLWLATIDTVTVYHDGRMSFRLKNGMEVVK